MCVWSNNDHKVTWLYLPSENAVRFSMTAILSADQWLGLGLSNDAQMVESLFEPFSCYKYSVVEILDTTTMTSMSVFSETRYLNICLYIMHFISSVVYTSSQFFQIFFSLFANNNSQKFL